MSIFYAISSPKAVRIFLGPLLRLRFGRDQRLKSELAGISRILVLKLDRIGDFVLSTPFLRELRKAAPNARITLVTQPVVANLAETCPHVNRMLAFDGNEKNGGISRIAQHVRVLRFCRKELWLDPPELTIIPRWDFDIWHATYLAYFSGARMRVAFSERVSHAKKGANKDFDLLLTDPVESNVAGKHKAERNLALLEHIGISISGGKTELWLTENDRHVASELLRQNNMAADARMLAIAPGSWEAKKKWPAEQFSELLHRMIPKEFAGAWLLGGQEDRSECEGIAAATVGRAISAAGKLTLRQTAALLEKCALYVGNDTGVKHLAAAAGLPVVEICSYPLDSDEENARSPSRFGAWGVTNRVVRPCEGFGISAVGVTEVEQAVNELMAAASQAEIAHCPA